MGHKSAFYSFLFYLKQYIASEGRNLIYGGQYAYMHIKIYSSQTSFFLEKKFEGQLKIFVK